MASEAVGTGSIPVGTTTRKIFRSGRSEAKIMFCGRKRDHMAVIGTSNCFQDPKIKLTVSPTKGDSVPRQTENLSDIFSIPRN